MALSNKEVLRPVVRAVVLVGLALGGIGLLAASAAAEVCPELTQTKYPFLTCAPNAYGGVTLGMPGYTAPPMCEAQMPNGDCKASPEPWEPWWRAHQSDGLSS